MSTRLGDALMIARYHIVLVAALGALVFGFLFGGGHLWAIAGAVAIDWFLVNLFNRITDLVEDERNQVPGTAWVARRKRAFVWSGLALFVGSFTLTALGLLGPPALLPLRALVQAMGVAYNYSVLGMKRWKEVYAWKNVASALIFVVTCFGYPLCALGWRPAVSWLAVALLVVYFVAFELTYEIFYDLRDLDGDREVGVPTFPVVHGERGARRIIDVLLVIAVGCVAIGVLTGALGVREALLAMAPITQAVYLRLRARNPAPLAARDGLVITHLGSAQLMLFLIGTTLWLRAGLPADIYLR